VGIAFAVNAAMMRVLYHGRISRFAKPQPRETSAAQTRGSSQGMNDDTGWLITLSDLTMLLLSFLIVWYVKNQEINATTGAANSATRLVQANDSRGKTLATSAHDADWGTLRDEMEKFIADAGMSGDVTIAAASDEILISFKDTVPFASGKADLRPEALPVLGKVAAVAVSRPALRLGIGGHTDDRPISTAEFPSNWELSSARASRVARYLVEKGVQPARIEVQGFADHRPRVPNGNSNGRGANRRVEVRLVRGGEVIAAQNSAARSR
jgi:chemotaxis protein MotB